MQKMADIHPQLRRDCLIIGRYPLCHLLLMLDANYPWFILVPNREGISEIYELGTEDQAQLMRESSHLAQLLAERFRADKINIAALGNLVPQLHLHHVVRYRDDPAWPAPIWGKVPRVPYTDDNLAATLNRIREELPNEFEFIDKTLNS